MLAASKYATDSSGESFEEIKALLRLEKRAFGGHLPEVFDQMWDWDKHSTWGEGVKEEANNVANNTPLKELIKYRGRFIAFDGRINKVYNSGTQSQLVYRGDSNTKTTVRIEKVKKGTNEPLKDAKFVLYNATLRQYLTIQKTLKTVSKTEATKTNVDNYAFITGKSGVKTISNIPPGIYEAIEVKAPEGYSIVNQNTQLINSIGGTSNPKATKIVNKEKTVDIQIKKVDATDTSKTLPKAGFTIKNTTTGKYINKKGEEVNTPQEIFTGADGYIKIEKVPYGKYEATETTAPPGYKVYSKTISISNKGVTTVKDSPDNGQLDIVIKKIDSKTSKPLSGAGFTIRNVTTGKYINASGQEIDTPVEIYTGSDGYIRITNVPDGEYEATETRVPNGYKAISNTVKIITNSETVVKNDPDNPPDNPPPGDGLIKVLEVNGQATSYPVKGMQFGIKYWEPDNKEYKVDGKREPQTSDSKYWDYVYHSRGYWHYYTVTETDENGQQHQVQKREWIDTSYYTYEYLYPEQYESDHAYWEDWKKGNEYYHRSQSNYMATATSDSSGKIYLSGFRTDGSYNLYEIGSSNPYFVVEGAPKFIMSGYRNTTTKTISNKRTYVDIEGNVFLDGQEGKTSTRNNVFDSGEGINGVKVTLKKGGEILSIASGKDSRGSSCATGHYKFWGDTNNLRIRTEELSQYTIEFEYNGLKYESIPAINIGRGNGSKAKENPARRNNFNYGYSQLTENSAISGGTSTNLSTRNGKIITYKSSEHKSEVLYKSSDSRFDDTYYADEQYHMQADTRTAGLDLGSTGTIGGYPYDPTKDTIEDINLGLYEIEHTDIALTSDLDTAEVSINGYSDKKTYQKRYGAIEDESAYQIDVKASDIYRESYMKEVRKSDVAYTNENNDDSQLNIYLTYRIVLKNQSSSIAVKVDKIVDYFSKDLEAKIVGFGRSTEDFDLAPMSSESSYKVVDGDGLSIEKVEDVGGYNKAYINIGENLDPGMTSEFYIQLKMTREAILGITESGKGLTNVVELNTCSAINGNEYTAVDKDSAVGNCNPGDEATMEDDTDYAPTINIKLSGEERSISGVVFEDYTDPNFLEKQERRGDGQYGEGDQLISGATVQLIDIDRGKVTRIYPAGNGKEATTISSSSGYNISGIVPGNYIIKYTYGSGTGKYTAQQYKSTITQRNYGSKWYNNSGERWSDAVDNYNGELKNKVGSVPINPSRVEIDNIWAEGSEDNLQHILNSTNIDSTISIDAFTSDLGLGVEQYGDSGSNGNGSVFAYGVQNIDFGIAERPRFKVQIDKTIKRIQLIKPDGSILRDFTDFKNPPADTKAIQTTKEDRVDKTINRITRGLVQFEIDSELLENTTLLIEYEFKATNRSELDYKSEGYYKYGDKFDMYLVRLSVENIIDYVDDELQYEANSHMIAEETPETQGHKNVKNSENGWSVASLDMLKKYVSSDAYTKIKTKMPKTILIGKGLDIEEKDQMFNPGESNGKDIKMLAPGESNTTTLLLNKALDIANDEMSYDNLAEIVEVKKTWGREIYKDEENTDNMYGETLGNLDPTQPIDDIVKNVREPDSHYSERISIITPTGANRNYTIYAIIGFACAAILTTGIILIKKKIL